MSVHQNSAVVAFEHRGDYVSALGLVQFTVSRFVVEYRVEGEGVQRSHARAAARRRFITKGVFGLHDFPFLLLDPPANFFLPRAKQRPKLDDYVDMGVVRHRIAVHSNIINAINTGVFTGLPV